MPQELGELVEPAVGPGRPEALVLCPPPARRPTPAPRRVPGWG